MDGTRQTKCVHKKCSSITTLLIGSVVWGPYKGLLCKYYMKPQLLGQMGIMSLLGRLYFERVACWWHDSNVLRLYVNCDHTQSSRFM